MTLRDSTSHAMPNGNPITPYALAREACENHPGLTFEREWRGRVSLRFAPDGDHIVLTDEGWGEDYWIVWAEYAREEYAADDVRHEWRRSDAARVGTEGADAVRRGIAAWVSCVTGRTERS